MYEKFTWPNKQGFFKGIDSFSGRPKNQIGCPKGALLVMFGQYNAFVAIHAGVIVKYSKKKN